MSVVSDVKKGPWQLHRSDTVYDNPWLRVEHHQVTTPGRQPGIYGKVCFKNIAVGVVPIDKQGYTYLVGQYRYPLESYSWEIPEGGCPLGASSADAARRELAEETGLRCDDLLPLMRLHTSNSCTDEVAQLYLARGLSQGQSAPEPCEDIALRRLPFSEAVAMAMSGEISDALSVAALLKVDRLLAEHHGDWAAVFSDLAAQGVR